MESLPVISGCCSAVHPWSLLSRVLGLGEPWTRIVFIDLVVPIMESPVAPGFAFFSFSFSFDSNGEIRDLEGLLGLRACALPAPPAAAPSPVGGTAMLADSNSNSTVRDKSTNNSKSSRSSEEKK